jgi:uncharacterized membrane protein
MHGASALRLTHPTIVDATPMNFISQYWLAFLCLAIALGFGIATLVRGLRRREWAWTLYLPALVFATFGVGAFDFAPWWVGAAILYSVLALYVLLLIIVITTGSWSALLGYGLAGLLLFGIGSLTGTLLAEALTDAGKFLLSLRPQEPWWLLLLLLIPVIFWTSWRNLISLGESRRWIALGLRCSLVVFLAFALAEVFARKPNDHITVMFLWDRSLSMPVEFQDGDNVREKRVTQFINQAVEKRGMKHVNDRVGVIVFGKQPRLELPPAAVPKLGFKKVHSQFDRSYTDLAGAIKLALASFPEGTGKRIVIISDGNENIGMAKEQADIAKQNGVQIDVLPITAFRAQSNEILIEPIETPVIEKDARIKIRVVVRSYHPDVVAARLTLRKHLDGPDSGGAKDNEHSMIVKLNHGLNPFTFTHQTSKEDVGYAYEATIVPLHVETHEGAMRHKGLPGDRIENNEARVAVIGRGQRSLLVLEPENGSHQLLIDRLRAVKSSLKIVSMTPEQMRNLVKGDLERLATFLSKFDATILANIPAESLTEEEQKVFRSNVFDQGAGLLMIGGNMGFGAGGWQNTEIEKALPVNCELKSMKIEGKSGLVLIMHASEMAEGNAWQRKIAKLALEKLSPMDMFGQIHYDHGFNGAVPGHRWHITFDEIGANRKRMMKLVDSMEPGDMPDVDPAFEKAFKELTNPEYRLGTKHMILISDGDHWDASRQMIQKIKNAKITCTTVCITTHGLTEVKKMAAVALATGGRPYHIKDPSELPAIYIKETRLVSQSFVHEDKKGFGPRVIMNQGPTEGMKEQPPPLYGFVRTTPKDNALVRVLIETPKIGEYKFPILATWQYGLGRSAAFTSDARTLAKGSVFWDRDWANSDLHAKFWEQTIDYILRPNETGQHLFLTTKYENGKIQLRLEGQDADKIPISDLDIKVGVSSPTFKAKEGKKFDVKFEQKETSGVYVAELPADEVGAYFLNIQAKWKRETIKNGQKVMEDVTDNVRAGVTIPYSPEFAEMHSSRRTLLDLSNITGGKEYADDAEALSFLAKSAEPFRPVLESHSSLQALWPWFVVLAATCLLFDVAIRRVSISPEFVWAKSVLLWEKLRGRAMLDAALPEYMERLRSRKTQVGETMEKQKAAKKFDAPAGTAKAGDAPTVVPINEQDKPKPAAPPKPAAKKEEEAGDFASRLMRAKKKAMEDRDKDKK